MRSNRFNRTGCLLLALGLLLTGCNKLERWFPSDAPQEGLFINEVVTSNQLSLQDEIYGSPDWIELYNGSDRTIDLSNYYITDNMEAPQKAFRMPGISLAPGAFYLLYASKKGGENCVGFSLKKEGEVLTLMDAHMEEISSLVVPALIRDVSYARRGDGSYGFCDLPTPGAPNGNGIQDNLPLSSQLMKEPEPETEEKPRSPDILITELVSKNKASLTADGCDGCTEWVELFNPNDIPVSLAGFTMTDDMNEGERHNFPEVEILPGQYLVVCCGRAACTAEGHVRVDIGLSAQGEELYLFDNNGYTLDHVSFPALPADVSWARGDEGSWGYCMQPTPGSASTEGSILSDLSPVPMDDPFHKVHIHEVLYRNEHSVLDEDGDRSDFVELYNGGDTAVDLNGWYLSDTPENMTKWPLPKVSFGPGAYLLVFLSGKDRDGGELHASFSLHAGETLVLYDSVSRRYDALLIPETAKNVSIGRSETGEMVYYSHPTPMEENGNPMPTGK